ncbi:MAG: CopG family transcriptional regulator [Proteobacteria bacterium]|nr:CopG family transcriptional regulator [Pseudomonadota bacterium]
MKNGFGKIFALAAATLLLNMPISLAAPDKKPTATLYKTPSCGCCEGYASFLRANGFEVLVEPVHNMPEVKKLAGVPNNLESCHTTMMGGYVVEGHVPLSAIEKLLSERPKIRGISLPEMPMGSPGMPGQKAAPFTTFEIRADGNSKVYAVD